jgi:hypothetical protein
LNRRFGQIIDPPAKSIGSDLKKNLRHFVLLVLTFSACVNLHAQSQPTANEVVIVGSAREENDQTIPNLIVINQRTRKGDFGKNDGSFRFSCLKTDTLTLTALGYQSRSICMKDSADKAGYSVIVYLESRTYQYPTVEIFAQRDLEKIEADIQKLGYNEKDYMLSGINAVQSPITFLYQQFSRKEQSKREVAMMENEDLKRDLLKELFHYYVDYEIIDLSDTEFDEFINFIHVSDDFMKNSSQYDFVIFVRDRYRDYKGWKRQKKLSEADYNYDKD